MFHSYYTRTVTNEPWRTQVHVTGATTGCLSCNLILPDGGPCNWATSTASRAGSYLTITCSSPNEPSATYIINPRVSTSFSVFNVKVMIRFRVNQYPVVTVFFYKIDTSNLIPLGRQCDCSPTSHR